MVIILKGEYFMFFNCFVYVIEDGKFLLVDVSMVVFVIKVIELVIKVSV